MMNTYIAEHTVRGKDFKALACDACCLCVLEGGGGSNLDIVIVRGQALGVCWCHVDVAANKATKVGLQVSQNPPQDILYHACNIGRREKENYIEECRATKSPM